MSITPEQEFKTLLPAATAQKLLQAFTFQAPFSQTNVYFDTPDQQLKAQHMGLRIRRFADHAEQTLKVPAGAHRKLLEYTDAISGDQLVADGVVAPQLAAAGIEFTQLMPFAQATTTRYLAPQSAGLLTLDHTNYPNGHSDWELEMEYQDATLAGDFWQQLAQDFAITLLPPQNKIQRAIDNVKSSQA